MKDGEKCSGDECGSLKTSFGLRSTDDVIAQRGVDKSPKHRRRLGNRSAVNLTIGQSGVFDGVIDRRRFGLVRSYDFGEKESRGFERSLTRGKFSYTAKSVMISDPKEISRITLDICDEGHTLARGFNRLIDFADRAIDRGGTVNVSGEVSGEREGDRGERLHVGKCVSGGSRIIAEEDQRTGVEVANDDGLTRKSNPLFSVDVGETSSGKVFDLYERRSPGNSIKRICDVEKKAVGEDYAVINISAESDENGNRDWKGIVVFQFDEGKLITFLNFQAGALLVVVEHAARGTGLNGRREKDEIKVVTSTRDRNSRSRR